MNASRRTVLTLPLLAAAFSRAAAQDVGRQFYKDKTIYLIVSTSAGGGYDVLARLVAAHIGKYIPGHPSVVVRNMPGAGGITAANYLYNSASKDGTALALLTNGTPLEPLFGTAEARFDPTKFNWLGSPSTETGLLVLWHTVQVKTLEEARNKVLTVGSTGNESTPAFYARLLNETLSLKLKIINGYPGVNEALLAMQNGELDGYPALFYSSLMSTKPTWLKDGVINALLQYGPAALPALERIAFAPGLITNPEDRKVMEAGLVPLALGRPFLMSPGVRSDRVETIRTALMLTFRDREFVAAAQPQQLLNSVQSGAQLNEIVAKAYQAPSAVIDRLKVIAHG